MDKDEDGQRSPPRNYTVAQMVRAVEKGAAQQIERMKLLLAQLESQEEPGATGDNSQDATAANSQATVSAVVRQQQTEK